MDYDHPAHLEGQGDSPFAAGDPAAEQTGGEVGNEHPPWTATSRGVETSLRRLDMLEPVYRLAPDLLRSGEGQLARRQCIGHQGGQDDRLPFAQARRFLSRHGPLRPGRLDPIHLRRTPRHRAGAAAQGAAPLLGNGLLLHEEDRSLKISNRVSSTRTRTSSWSPRPR